MLSKYKEAINAARLAAMKSKVDGNTTIVEQKLALLRKIVAKGDSAEPAPDPPHRRPICVTPIWVRAARLAVRCPPHFAPQPGSDFSACAGLGGDSAAVAQAGAAATGK